MVAVTDIDLTLTLARVETTQDDRGHRACIWIRTPSGDDIFLAEPGPRIYPTRKEALDGLLGYLREELRELTAGRRARAIVEGWFKEVEVTA